MPLLSFLAAGLVVSQAAAVAVPPAMEQDRLLACMREARNDPATAITTASQWLEGLAGPDVAGPQQCLGYAYMGLLRWDAAMAAFSAARDARLPGDHDQRARLGMMAGNAALAASQFLVADGALSQAIDDALASGQAELAGEAAADRARALVALNDAPAAAASLERARELSPQDANVWLLSATLARRMEDLSSAGNWIGVASQLDPASPAIGLEAGLISALSGNDDAARASWQSVIATSPATPEAERARGYIAVLDQPPEAE